MLNTTEPNVTLNSKQLSSMEIVKQKLANLEREVVISSRNLSVLNKDTIKTIQNNKYQEEISEKLSKEIVVKTGESESLEASIKQLEDRSLEISKENIERSLTLDIKESEIKNREKDLVVSENVNKTTRGELDGKVKDVDESRKKIDNALREFSKIKWS